MAKDKWCVNAAAWVRDWQVREDCTTNDACRRLGLSRTQFYRLLNGEVELTFAMADKIAKATDGTIQEVAL